MKNNQPYSMTLILYLLLFLDNNATVTLIETAGAYPLGSSIIADPIILNDTIITISASNTILDINEYILTQVSTNTLDGLVGIFIQPNLSNITIKNGAIENITGCGVYVSDGCSKLYLDNLLISGCAQGIFFEGITTGSGINEATIKNCLITECIPTDSNNAYGIRLRATNNIIIENCIINNTRTTLSPLAYGISIESCLSCEVNHCKSYNNGGTLFGAGIALSESNGCSFFNCKAANNRVTSLSQTGTACGFYVTSSNISLFSNCFGNNNINTAGYAIGFYSLNNSTIFLENCKASANVGGLLSAGVYSGGTDSIIGLKDNIFNINRALSINGKAYGILLNGTQKSSINGNTISNNTAVEGYGLVDTTLNTNNLILSNLSFNNTTTGYVVTFTDGTLPVLFASNNNFSNLVNGNHYFNVAIVPD